MRNRIAVLSYLLLGVVVYGCAGAPARPPVQPAATGASAASQPAYWWFVRFRFERDKDASARFFLDPLVADQVVAPVLAAHRNDLLLWRFHRRAAEDAAGHQFSFLFYADGQVAQRVMAEIGEAPVLEHLRDEGLLKEVIYDQTVDARRSQRAATSDGRWPAEVQREWPKFIMGASEMWLGLVQSEADKYAEAALLARYQYVEEALGELWFEQAQHAFFHHLSALFGYQPVRVTKREVITF